MNERAGDPTSPASASDSSAVPASDGAQRPWYGPRILAVGFVSYFFATGLHFSILGLFIAPAAAAFSASMATMGLIPSFHHLITAVMGPVLGARYATGSIRRFMVIGALLLPLGHVAVSRSSSLALAAVCYGGLSVVGAYMLGSLASNTLVTNWYGPSRGRALGIITTGATAAGVLLPTLAAWLIEAFGWRDALALIALGSLPITLGVFGLWAVDRPESIGQRPEPFREDGLAPSPTTPPASDDDVASTKSLLASPYFWAFAAGFGILFSSSLVSMTFIVPYAKQLGLSLQMGASILAARSAAAIAGQLSLSWLSDRVGRRGVLLGSVAFHALCWALLARAPNAFVFTAAGIGIGFVSGAYAPIRGALLARFFGRRDFAKVSGLLAPASLPFQILAVPLTGWVYDQSGDYATAFTVFLVAFPIAALLVAFIPDRR